jgi:hypothetical protein
MLGLWSVGPLNVLLVDPVLPEWLPELTVRNIAVGQGRVSIRFRRGRKGETRYQVLNHQGPVRVVRQSPPEDRHAGPLTRLRELVGSLLAGH